MGERKKRIGGTGMKWYAIGKTLTPLDRAPESGAAVVLLNSALSASAQPAAWRANSITAICIPRQMPR